MKGHGDLVLTDLRNPSSPLEFGKGMQGEYYVCSSAIRLFIELDKKTGTTEVLALEPGHYEIVRYAGSQYYSSTVDLDARRRFSAPGTCRPLCDSCISRHWSVPRNYADRSQGLSLAPIMVVLNGIVRAETWIDGLGMLYGGFRMAGCILFQALR